MSSSASTEFQTPDLHAPGPPVAAKVGNGTVAVYSDIVCPWATIVIERLRIRRYEQGSDVVLDLRPLPLEILNEGPVSNDLTNRGADAAATVLPDYGFAPRESTEAFPVTSIPALEAVRAAYEQSPGAAESLDAALRRAFFVDHECISLHHVLVDVASRCDDVDAAELDDRLRSGRSKCDVFEHFATAQGLDVDGSPHVFLADGTACFSPSIEIAAGDEGIEIVRDEPDEIDAIIDQARQTREAD